jgi:hypothetical protein
VFDKIGRLAEAAANRIDVSRRGFLGRLGQGAMAVGALLAGSSAAAGQGGGAVCCIYECPKGPAGPPYRYPNVKRKCQKAGTTCAPPQSGCALIFEFPVTDCTNCSK